MTPCKRTVLPSQGTHRLGGISLPPAPRRGLGSSGVWTAGKRGVSFPGGGGRVNRALWLDPPRPPKRAQSTGLPKSYRDGPPLGPRGDRGPKIGKK